MDTNLVEDTHVTNVDFVDDALDNANHATACCITVNDVKDFMDNSWRYSDVDAIFASNNTRHASHLNSAPGRVFDFYRGTIL